MPAPSAPPLLVTAAAALLALPLASCGSSSGGGDGNGSKIDTARLGVSLVRAQKSHAVDRGTAVNATADCTSMDTGTWTCRVTFATASPEGAVDTVERTYRVTATGGACWQAVETGVTSGRPARLAGCV